MKKIFESKKTLILIGIVLLVLILRNFDVPNFIKSIHPHKGDFIKVGKMSFPRWGHESILLDDGRVLIFGGSTEAYGDNAEVKKYKGSLQDIQIYNPITKKFTTVGKMNDYRHDYSATKLKNGKILITGGRSENKELKSTRIFNPKTEKFEQSPYMNFYREDHTATLLNDGRVLISGGNYAVYKLIKKNIPDEIYNPITGKFTTISSLNIPRLNHSAILLNDGKVLIVGGNNTKGNLSSAEIYDPKTNKFEFIGNMNLPKVKPYLYLLKNGEILIANAFDKEIEIYNPKANTFKIIAKRTSEPNMPTEVLLNNDKILFTGGSNGVGLSLVWYKSSEIFDPETHKFIKGKDMNFRRDGHRATLLKDGNVLITGSVGTGRTAELYIDK